LEGEGALNPRDAKAYVFDLDGTLATIPVDWDAVRAKLKAVTGIQEEFKPIFPTIGGVIAKNPRLGLEVFSVIDEFESAAAPSARLYEGASELLAKLSERALVSLVTMQGRKTANRILDSYGLKRFFSSCFTREDSMDRAEQLEMALSSMRADRTTSVFVGDRLNDLNAAKKVGIPFVLVRTHGSDPEEGDFPVYHTLAEFAAALD
jgi:phosphoglycolate phosphatase-like HAD superfamily hydrolase